MSSSSDATGLWAAESDVTGVLETPELREGTWTRLGDRAVLGDQVTERALSRLAQSTVAAARAQGYAVGWAEGRRDAAAQATVEAAEAAARQIRSEEQRDEEHARALTALEQTVDAFNTVTADLAAQLEEQALRLARELTEVLLGRELALATDPADDVVRRVLTVLPDGSVPVIVRVHPDVHASTSSEALSARGVTVVADPDLDAHDAVVETPTSYVDRGVAAALSRVQEALS